MTLIMLGRGDGIARNPFPRYSAAQDCPELIENVDRVIEALAVSVGSARELLMRTELEMRRRIGLPE
jgi:hypothetical protein